MIAIEKSVSGELEKFEVYTNGHAWYGIVIPGGENLTLGRFDGEKIGFWTMGNWRFKPTDEQHKEIERRMRYYYDTAQQLSILKYKNKEHYITFLPSYSVADAMKEK